MKIVGSHSGVTVGEDGATHQALEDISLMRTIPGMRVIVPCDGYETRCAVQAMMKENGPCYLRTGRGAVETITDNIQGYEFTVGKGITLAEGEDVTLIACGLMVQEAMKAREILREKKINARVIDMHTIKPIDAECVCNAARETGAIVTCEEHNIIGGLGLSLIHI